VHSRFALEGERFRPGREQARSLADFLISVCPVNGVPTTAGVWPIIAASGTPPERSISQISTMVWSPGQMLDETVEDADARTASAEVRLMCPCTAPVTRLPTGIDSHDGRGGDLVWGARGEGNKRGRWESGPFFPSRNVNESSLARMCRACHVRLCCTACREEARGVLKAREAGGVLGGCQGVLAGRWAARGQNRPARQQARLPRRISSRAA
jgi:hypothetical protein